MTVKKNYINPTIAESSFRELLKDQPFGINNNLIVTALKEIVHFSFKDENIFEHKYIDGDKKVRLVHQVTVNRENGYAWANDEPHSEYNLKLPGIVIPLLIKNHPVIQKGRLVLVGPITGPIGIEIQVCFKGSKEWSYIPATTHNVLNILTHLFKE